MKTAFFLLFGVAALAAWPLHVDAQSVVSLGSAAGFAVLAGTGITVAGATNSTTINGDIGTFPTLSITGLSSVVLNGTNHAGDAVTQTAKTDLLAAFNDAASRSPTTTYAPAYDLGGQTLTPGVYNNPSSFGITGNLTLDAQGNPNAVWIFQAGSSLSTSGGSQIILLNSAQAGNIFWKVGDAATLGNSSIFTGYLLAYASIGFGSGAVIDGGLMSTNGSVTLDGNNTISITTGGIPEPASTAVLIAGCLGLVAIARRIRRRS